MPSLQVLSGREVVRIFSKDGWQIARQRGSHIILVKDSHNATVSVRDHKEVVKGTLRGIIRASDLTVEQFLALVD